jgi:hypothetical protein
MIEHVQEHCNHVIEDHPERNIYIVKFFLQRKLLAKKQASHHNGCIIAEHIEAKTIWWCIDVKQKASEKPFILCK